MTFLVTGATGLIGANVVEQLLSRGDDVRALIRPESDSTQLRELGADIVDGDITVEADVFRAAEGCSAIINSAALLGGPGQNLEDQLAANYTGSVWCYDAAKRNGAKVIELTTTPFLRQDITLTERPELKPDYENSGDPYAISKGRAYVDGLKRAEAGDDLCFVIPGGTFGPSPVPARAMAPTSYTRLLRGGIRGTLKEYASFPVPWVLARDVAAVVVGALDSGVPGLAYIAFGAGPPISTAAFLSLGCEAAGVEHRVRDVVMSPGDPEARKRYGDTIYDMATRIVPDPLFDDSVTRKAFGLNPTPVREGVAETVSWMREHGYIDG